MSDLGAYFSDQGTGLYRRRAVECVELAQHARPQDRTLFLNIAQAWLALADNTAADAELLQSEAIESKAGKAAHGG